MNNDERLLAAAAPLLEVIRKHESRGDYDIVFSKAKTRPPAPISQMKLADISKWQDATVRAGSFSSAAGAYQFIRNTLSTTMREMALDGSEVWTPALQDRMALHLLNKRGFRNYVTGKIDLHPFMLELAKEWASLPRPDNGRSYYAGDGVNKAHASVSEMELAARRAKYLWENSTGPKSVSGRALGATAAATAATATAAATAVAAQAGVPLWAHRAIAAATAVAAQAGVPLWAYGAIAAAAQAGVPLWAYGAIAAAALGALAVLMWRRK